MNPVRIVAFTKSMNKEPTSGTTMNAVGAGPYTPVIACMFAIAFGVAPIPNPQKPLVVTSHNVEYNEVCIEEHKYCLCKKHNYHRYSQLS